jgi:hypothetical protein
MGKSDLEYQPKSRVPCLVQHSSYEWTSEETIEIGGVQQLWETSVVPGESSIHGGKYILVLDSTTWDLPYPFYGLEASPICAKCRQARVTVVLTAVVHSMSVRLNRPGNVRQKID